MEEIKSLLSLVGDQGITAVFAFLFYVDLRKVVSENTKAVLLLAQKQGVQVNG